MSRGGFRPNAGRPRKTVLDGPIPKSVARAAKGNATPLEYMLAVMRDPAADPLHRDRMAIAAAPFVHAKPGDKGIKATAMEAARNAGADTDWGDDLIPPDDAEGHTH